MKKRIWLVTGGAGFIGSNAVEELVKRGEKVRVIDDFSTGFRKNLAPFAKKIEIIRGDIKKMSDLKRAMKGVTFVLHFAAIRSVPKSVDDPRSSNDANVTGTLNVLMAAKDAKVKRVVYSSSSSVYGDCEKFPQKETFQTNPISPYAVSKLAGENYCMVFSKTFSLETIALRYFNVFGPRQNPESKYSAVIPKFMESFKFNRPLEIHWDGKQSRDFTYVGDVIRANIASALAPSSAIGKYYNIAEGKSVSLLQIISILEKETGKKPKRNFKPQRKGDVRKTWADPSKARKEMKFVCKTSFKDGLIKTWKYFSKHYGA
ncbi:MAG: GDP-mannose 4,6-dehydratase [Elusimicrobia bacterium]|nr:GDP-mannose 4,6-dehydratase [Elusimicrobiota bacterium]